MPFRASLITQYRYSVAIRAVISKCAGSFLLNAKEICNLSVTYKGKSTGKLLGKLLARASRTNRDPWAPYARFDARWRQSPCIEGSLWPFARSIWAAISSAIRNADMAPVCTMRRTLQDRVVRSAMRLYYVQKIVHNQEIEMTVVTYTEMRNNFKHYCDMACENSESIVVTRERAENVVMISEQEWESIQETLFFLSDENRMERLRAAEKDLREGDYKRFQSAADLRKQVTAGAR